MSNPFKGKVRVEEPTLPLVEFDEDFIQESFEAQIAPSLPPPPSAWQRVMGVVSGKGITPLPAAPINSNERISKRRLRRLRGQMKATRTTARYQ